VIRRTLVISSIVSAVLAVLAAAVSLRGRFCQDHLLRCHWDPTTRTYGEISIYAGGGTLSIHSELAPATPTEDTTAVRMKAGPTGTGWTHASEHHWSNGYMGEPKVIWVDRYRAGPLTGINPHGLADCWTVICKLDAVAAVFCVLPALLLANRWRVSRARSRRGFLPAMTTP